MLNENNWQSRPLYSEKKDTTKFKTESSYFSEKQKPKDIFTRIFDINLTKAIKGNSSKENKLKPDGTGNSGKKRTAAMVNINYVKQ